MKILLFTASVCAALLVRTLRWLAIIQQKEYRFDRLRQFIASTEGRDEVLRILPKRSDFSRTGLKRPQCTARILLTSLVFLSCTLILFATLVAFFLPVLFGSQTDLWSFLKFMDIASVLGFVVVVIGSLLLFLFLIPYFLIFFAVLGTWVGQLVVYYFLYRAQSLIVKQNPHVIGITGSYGKTTTRHLLTHLLRSKYSVATPDRSINTTLGVAQWLIGNYNNEEILVLEYGAYARGEIARLAAYFPPDDVIITGLAPQHLGLFGSFESIVEAKTELLEGMKSDGTIFFTADNSRVQTMVKSYVSDYVRKTEQYSADDIVVDRNTLNIQGKYRGVPFSTSLIGRHFVENIAGALCVVSNYGITPEIAITQLESFSPQFGFIKQKKHASGAVIIDDSRTANPRGVQAALALLDQYPQKHKIIMFSGIVDLGEQSDSIHEELAKKAQSIADECWYVGSTGRDVWQRVWKKSIYVDAAEIVKRAQLLGKNQVLLLEGFIPKKYMQEFAQYPRKL